MRPGPNAGAASFHDLDTLVVEILGFLASDARRCEQFLAASGLSPADLRAMSTTPAFAQGLLDHLCADETLLVAFAQSHDYSAEAIDRLRRSMDPRAEDG